MTTVQRSALGVFALAGMLPLAVSAQEVKVSQYWDGYEFPVAVGGGPLGFQLLYYGGSCSRATLRTMTSDGHFADSELSLCDQTPDDIAIAPSGAFLVVGGRSDGSGGGIVGQVFDPTGSPIGSYFWINTETIGAQVRPRATYVESDRYAVLWTDERRNTVVGRIVMPDGSMPGGEVLIAPVGSETASPDLAAASGVATVLAVWGNYSGPYSRIEARVLDADLVPITAESTVSTIVGSNGIPSVSSGPPGFLVVWNRTPAGAPDGDVAGRLLDPQGAPSSPEFIVNDTTTGAQSVWSGTMEETGRSIVVWDSDDGSFRGVYARRIDEFGAKLGSEFRVNGTTFRGQDGAHVGLLPSGAVAVAWSSGQDPDYSDGVFARRYVFPLSLLLAPGRGPANPPTVQVTQPDGLDGQSAFSAYGTGGFGTNVGAGDLDGDGIHEALTGPGPSGTFGPQVRAFRPDGTPVQKVNFYAYGTLRFGARVAGENIETDAFDEILTAPGAGQVFGPHIRGWDFDGTGLQPIGKVNYFAYSTLRWGARAVGGDVDGDGIREVLTGPGPGAIFGPHIRGFNYDGLAVASMGKVSFMAFASGQYGATVSAADVESDGRGAYGDGYQEIVVGRGPDPGAGTEVRLFDFDGSQVLQKYEVTPYVATSFGANVAGGDIDAGDSEEVVTAPGPDPAAAADVMAWEWDPVIDINPDGPRLQILGPDQFTWGSYTYGANVAIGTFE